MKTLFLLVVVAMTATAGFSQQRTLTWDEELCTFEGTYDSSKYTEAQLRDTIKLKSMLGSIALSTSTTAFRLSDIPKLSVEKLTREYREKRRELNNLDVVKTKFWLDLKQMKLKEMDEYFALGKTAISAYSDFAAVSKFKATPICSKFYGAPLEFGGDYLLTTWKKVNMDTRQRNASPSRIKRIFDSQNASPRRMEYARLEVIGFGWWNCALNETGRTDFIDANDELRKLFTKVKEDCEEPE